MLIITAKGWVVGQFEEGVYRKTVKGSIHMMQSPMGWASDKDICEDLAKLGCKEIRIFDKEKGKTFVASFEEFMAKAIPIDRGYGEQLALPLRYWKVE